MADKKISQLTGVTVPLAGTEELPAVQSGTTKKVTVAQMQAAPIAAQTANSVVYLNGSKVPSTAANLSYNGSTTFTLNGVSNPALYEVYSSSMSGDRARMTNDPNNNVGIKLSSDYLDLELAPGVLDGSRNVKMTSANLVIGTAGKGIDFSANTHAAGMTSELLNDYEEGTWTTTVSGVTNFTGTPTLASGKYTRVGRLVTIEGKFSAVVTTGSTNAYFEFTLPISRSAATDGGAGSVFANTNLKLGGIYNASANTTTAYLVMPSSSAQPSGADTFFFSYSYNA